MAFSPALSTFARRLEGKVALITGGASGVGESTAKIFAQHGAKVVIADVQDDRGHSIRESIGPKDCTFVHCDVTDEAHVKNAVQKAVATYGKLDIMFNNAGIPGEYRTRIIDSEKADFERVLSINATGVFLGIKHAAQVMIPARKGSIISTGSVVSTVGGTPSHAYCCSKHAVAGLTKNAAAELGQFGIRVNCVSPFGLATSFAKTFLKLEAEEEIESMIGSQANLKGMTLKTEDVANAALYLASDEARYISGHNLLIDGGFSVVKSSSATFYYPPER